MRDASLPITLIVVGVIWLAWYFGWFPDVDWVIAIGLAAGGVAVLAFDGFTKSSVVIGPFMITAGIAWLIHDQYRISWKVLVATMMIVLGVLMLIARNPRIPVRRGQPPTSD